MSYYDEYKDLLNRRYVTGDADCYGLVRDYYREVFQLDLTNYARPENFHDHGLDLIVENLADEGFQIIDIPLSKLQRGDGILFRVGGAQLCNHLGAYVGNNYFIHHLWNGVSCEEDLDVKWKGRVMSVVRHPIIEEKNRIPKERYQLVDFLPHILREKVNEISNG